MVGAGVGGLAGGAIGVYQDRQDNTVTVGLRLEEPLRQAVDYVIEQRGSATELY